MSGRRPRILLDCRMATWSGVGRYATGLARELVRRNEFALVLAEAEGKDLLLADASVERIVATRHPFTPGGGFELGEIARDARADLVHCLHFPTPIPTPHPLVVTVHDLTPLVDPSVMRAFPHRLGYRWWNARVARVADRILANSTHTAADIARFFPGAAGKTTVVPHTAGDFADGPAGDLPAGLVPPGASYVLSMGNTKPHKDLPTLLSAFARVAIDRPDLHLLLVGREVPGYVASVLGADLAAARVHFTGHVGDPELRALYRDAAVFAFPSRYEGFGLPPLEAMAFGTPVVCSDAASLPEVVGEAALLFPAGDAEALASRMARVLDDDAVREKLRAAGPLRAASFTWMRTAELTAAAYRELLDR
jgi:glycosyltransferase involved in cell wall biosynthesis